MTARFFLDQAGGGGRTPWLLSHENSWTWQGRGLCTKRDRTEKGPNPPPLSCPPNPKKEVRGHRPRLQGRGLVPASDVGFSSHNAGRSGRSSTVRELDHIGTFGPQCKWPFLHKDQ